MTQGGSESNGVLRNQSDASVEKEHEKQMPPSKLFEQNIVDEIGFSDGNFLSVSSNDGLIRMLLELDFQNKYMQAQYGDMMKYFSHDDRRAKLEVQGHHQSNHQDDIEELHREIESLKGQLLEERKTHDATEEALELLRAAHKEAEMKLLETSAKLNEVQQQMDLEIKARDEKYSELDSRLNRLHKRAKQRIQEVQKEKDDLDVQFREISEKADIASSQLSALKQELDQSQKNASDTLKAMDIERKQLRSANNKLRDTVEELRHSLAPQENALEAMQQSLLEKDQLLEETRRLLKVTDEKWQASIAELSVKHQKQVQDMEAQIGEAFSERRRAAETISSLHSLIAEKDAKIVEMEAASSGEAARLKASMETLKGEFNHLENEHSNAKDVLEAAIRSLKSKHEISERNRVLAEVEAAKLRSQLESELAVLTQLVNGKDVELEEAKEKISRIENEFASYKVRAHSLLQKKDAELASARDNNQFQALEDAEREIHAASMEKDKALKDLKDLKDALLISEKEISSRDAALNTAKQQFKTMQKKLDCAQSDHQLEKETWEKTLKNVEETWRLRCEALERQTAESPDDALLDEIERLKLSVKTLQEEQKSFRDLADKMLEEKDKEISRLWDDKKNLQQSLDSRPSSIDHQNELTAFRKQDASNSGTSAAEQQIIILARQQAQREEELAQTQRHILALQEEIEELEHENRLHRQQEAMLKDELRNMERAEKREGVDLTYLKNVILKLLETGEVSRLLPVVAMLLQFSPDEVQKCQQAASTSSSSNEPPATTSSTSNDSGRSLFSRLSFS